jgi:chorismate mutase
MANDYIVIHKKVLPDYFEKVLEIKELVNQGENVSDACKKIGLARSTFYKYKDFVTSPEKNVEKKLLLSLKLVDEPGSLLEVVKEIYAKNLNIASVNLEPSIHKISLASIMLLTNEANFNFNPLVVNNIGDDLVAAKGAAANASTNLSFPPTYPSLATNNSETWSKSALLCLTATIFLYSFASFAIVEGSILTPVLPGIL